MVKVVMTGASGLIGSALVSFLHKQGCEVVCLVRREPTKREEAWWNPETGEGDRAVLEKAEVLINLCGENIAQGRWTAHKQRNILHSRIQSTKTLGHWLHCVDEGPKLWINGSAIGIYGNRGDVALIEQDLPGQGFLAEVCKQWEQAALEHAPKEVRVALLRTATVLCAHGGALHKMLPLFRWGLGGPLGTGAQYMSWISLPDLVHIIYFIMQNRLSGPINAVSPTPLSNTAFAQTLAHVLHRPLFLRWPAWWIHMVLGKMGQEVLLASQRAYPQILQQAGYSFMHPILEDALSFLLKG